MPGPWDDRAKQAAPSETDRLFFAMRRAGMRVVSRDDTGEAGRWVGAIYTFACGCTRTYRGNIRERTSTEQVTPCEDHRNLLTSLVRQAQDGVTTEMQGSAEQRRDTDGQERDGDPSGH